MRETEHEFNNIIVIDSGISKIDIRFRKMGGFKSRHEKQTF